MLPEICKQWRQFGKAQRFVCADYQAAVQFAFRAQLIFSNINFVENIMGVFQQSFAPDCQRHTLADAVKQFYPQFLFQIFDLYCDCGLGISQVFCGF